MRSRIWIAAAAAVIITAGVLLGSSLTGRRPFRTLAPQEVQSITVELTPPDIQLAVSNEEMREIIRALNEVVVYQRDDDALHEYCGQLVTFHITKTDGSQASVSEYSPFIVIDGIAFRAKHAPCDELNRLANDLDAHKDGSA